MGASEIVAEGRAGKTGMTSAPRVTQDAGPSGNAMPSTAKCSAALLGVIGLLKTVGFARTLRLLRRRTHGIYLTDRIPFEHAEAVARDVARLAAFYPGRARCLQQSLAVYYLLRRMGMRAEFRMGVQPVNFAAHAWVEYHGEPVMEGELVHTVVAFPKLPV